jgi:hypothetical protein
LINNYLSPLFAKNLAGLGTPEIIQREKTNTSKKRFLSVVSGIFTQSIIEKSAFEFVWNITARDRKFKVRAYPIFGMMIYFLYNYFTEAKKEDFNVLMVLYYTIFSIWVFTEQIYLSDDWKAAWLYRITPLDKPGEIILGGIKSILVKIGIPVFIIVGTVLMIKAGLGMLDDIIFAMCSTLLFMSLNIFKSEFSMPFSTEVANGKVKGGQWVRFLILFIIAPILGFIHYFVAKTSFGLIVLAPIFLIIALLLLREYRKIGWDKIKEHGA